MFKVFILHGTLNNCYGCIALPPTLNTLAVREGDAGRTARSQGVGDDRGRARLRRMVTLWSLIYCECGHNQTTKISLYLHINV